MGESEDKERRSDASFAQHERPEELIEAPGVKGERGAGRWGKREGRNKENGLKHLVWCTGGEE